MFELIFYRLENNTAPVEEFLNGLEPKMSDLSKYINEQLNDPKFKAEYEASETEYQLTRALISARAESNMTQKELASRSGVRQSNISRIENGTCSPTVATLQALAEGLGKKLVINFV